MWRDWVCLRGMQKSIPSDNEWDLAVPAQFALRLKTPIWVHLEGKDGIHMPTTGRLIAKRADNGRYVRFGGDAVRTPRSGAVAEVRGI